MFRTILLSAAAALATSAAAAQAPAPGPGTSPPKTVKVHAELEAGGRIEVRQPDIIDGKLCGWIIATDSPTDVMPKAGCIPMNEIASTRVEGAGAALAESTDGSLCIVLMPLCLAKVSAVQNRIVRKAIEKAGNR